MAMSWLVSAVVRLNASGFTAGMARMSASTNQANTALLRQQGLISRNQAAMERYRAKIEEARLAQIKMGTTLAGFGAATGVVALGFAIAKAADLERAMTGVQIATHASREAFAQMYQQVIAVSGITAQSAVTIANEMQAAATVAFKDPKQLMSLFPMMAKYADVRYMASGGSEDPKDTITQMATFAHYFAAYGPSQMKRMLDDTARVQMTTHAQLNQLVTQGKYFIPNAVKLGVSENDIMQYLAIMGQTGFLQGKGGTALNNLILGAEGAVSPTAHLAAAKRRGLHDLDLYDSQGRFRFVDDQGHLLLDQMVKHLQAMRTSFEAMNPRTGGGRWMADIAAAFGKEAQRFVSVVADPVTRGQMNRNAASMAKMPGVEGQWQLYRHNFFYQWNAFRTNLENIATTLAGPSLPALTNFIGGLNTQLQTAVGFLAKNPSFDQRVMGGIAALTGIFTVRFAVGIVAAAGGLFRLSASIDALNVSLALGGAGAAAGAGGAAAAAGRGGLFGRIGGAFRAIMGALDGFFLAGLGGKAIALSSRTFNAATHAVGVIFDALGNAIRSGAAGYAARIARFGSSGFRSGVIADMQKGMSGLIDLFMTPLKNSIADFMHFAPGFAEAAWRFSGALARIAGALAPLLKFLGGPLTTIAGLVLSPTAAGSDEQAWLDSHPSRGRRPTTQVHIENLHIGGDPKQAGKAASDFVTSFANHPGVALKRAGAFVTSPGLAMPQTVGGMVFGK